MKKYKEFQKDLVLELDKETITAPLITTLTSKLFQLSNGFVYDEEKIAHDLHDEKIEALKELEGENMIVAYWFKHDLVKLKKAFPDAKVINEENIKLWNEGKIKMLLAHPASAGHGLNLQQGGSILVWYSLTWSLELYQQMIGRIYRQGQTKSVRIIHLVAKNTMDERIVDVLNNKEYTQMTLLNFVKMACDV